MYINLLSLLRPESQNVPLVARCTRFPPITPQLCILLLQISGRQLCCGTPASSAKEVQRMEWSHLSRSVALNWYNCEMHFCTLLSQLPSLQEMIAPISQAANQGQGGGNERDSWSLLRKWVQIYTVLGSIPTAQHLAFVKLYTFCPLISDYQNYLEWCIFPLYANYFLYLWPLVIPQFGNVLCFWMTTSRTLKVTEP